MSIITVHTDSSRGFDTVTINEDGTYRLGDMGLFRLVEDYHAAYGLTLWQLFCIEKGDGATDIIHDTEPFAPVITGHYTPDDAAKGWAYADYRLPLENLHRDTSDLVDLRGQPYSLHVAVAAARIMWIFA